MKTVLFVTAMIVGLTWLGIAPDGTALSAPTLGNTNIQIALVENVGYRRRYYRRYGYSVPYASPPAYGYYLPPAVYVYPPTIYAAPGGDYAGGPPPEGDYADVPDEGYQEDPPPEADYAEPPPQDGY